MVRVDSAGDDVTITAEDATPVRTLILVISMGTAADRRERFAARAAEATVPWEFMDAFTSLHPSLRYDEEAAMLGRGRALERAEIGCYSSHFEAWKRLLASDADQLVVIEDDVIVDWRFLSELAKIDLAAQGLHFFRLFIKRLTAVERTEPGIVGGGYRIVTLTGYPYGGQGYAMTRSAAERLIPYFTLVDRPIDDAIDRSWVHGIPNRAIFPSPIIEEFAKSTIGLDRYGSVNFPKHLLTRRRIAVNIDRLQRFVIRHITGRGKRDAVGPQKRRI
ncbi:glycosyltransferase family 25 protein [Sphingomonas montanisoli]|uniref:Glycosyltransferase family 25 protein n=1 Tax=Sphingomonas montanisoli TaxID=2606412 RepID=A0A5D9C2G5_9SPHN|nr:glycosyltransferase family 25 protein [Sphingomonas montanisoli]TZG25849.1 glycosyltransferase family 25 protein [Sphingomonas montanisoli]